MWGVMWQELVKKLMSTLSDIISREKQLQDIGGKGGKLSLGFRQEWQEAEAALAMIPYEVCFCTLHSVLLCVLPAPVHCTLLGHYCILPVAPRNAMVHLCMTGGGRCAPAQ